LRDLEFLQFHPTALKLSGVNPAPLVSEAVRGAGAVLVDRRGERFLRDLDPRAELAPRHVVARAVAVADGGGGAWLDARRVTGFAERFPAITAVLERHGLDPGRDLLPVAPAMHYAMGGVATDLAGRSTRQGLWAVGEVACTGVHGANRLASNSLLEGLVFADRAARALAVGRGSGWRRVPVSRSAHTLPGGRADEERAALGPEIQDVADVVADSLTMARCATQLDAPVLVICGVHFMAETAAIANPEKRVLIPDLNAGCSLADTIRPEDVRAWRGTHPDGLVVAYVNCSAAV